MSLLQSEVQRIKFELGYNQLTVNSEPFIGHAAVFELVIQPFMQSGASTTSSTAITAADTPTLASLTLSSVTGFSIGDRIVVDVDGSQEFATIRTVSGAVVTAFLSLAHSGTYPVTVEGGEAIVRQILSELRKLTEAGGFMSQTVQTAGIKEVVGEVVFSEAIAMSRQRQVRKQIDYWRDELALALGVANLRAMTGGGAIAMY